MVQRPFGCVWAGSFEVFSEEKTKLQFWSNCHLNQPSSSQNGSGLN